MSLQIHIDVSNSASPELQRIVSQVRPGGPLGMALGRALSNTLKTHFRKRNAKGNRLGGKRTNFWSRIASSVQNPVVSTGQVSVTVSDRALRQKVFGGRIVPVNAKALSVAASKKAYGKSPRVFDDLAFIPNRKGADKATVGFLVEGVQGIIKRGKNKGETRIKPKPGGALMYVLRAYVDQERDPEALPEEPLIIADLLTAARAMLSK